MKGSNSASKTDSGACENLACRCLAVIHDAARLGRDTAKAWGFIAIEIDDHYGAMAAIDKDGACIAKLVPRGWSSLDNELVRYSRKEHSLVIGERMAEEIRITTLRGEKGPLAIHGRDADRGEKRILNISAATVLDVLEPALAAMAAWVIDFAGARAGLPDDRVSLPGLFIERHHELPVLAAERLSGAAGLALVAVPSIPDALQALCHTP